QACGGDRSNPTPRTDGRAPSPGSHRMSESATQFATLPPTRNLLVVEDDSGLQTQMRWAMSGTFAVHLAGHRRDAMSLMERCHPALVILDLGLPPDANGASEGLSALDSIVNNYPGTKVIVASGNEDRVNALKAVAYGAYDFFTKPVDIDKLR